MDSGLRVVARRSPDEGAPPSNDMSKLGEQVKQWWVTPYQGP